MKLRSLALALFTFLIAGTCLVGRTNAATSVYLSFPNNTLRQYSWNGTSYSAGPQVGNFAAVDMAVSPTDGSIWTVQDPTRELTLRRWTFDGAAFTMSAFVGLNGARIDIAKNGDVTTLNNQVAAGGAPSDASIRAWQFNGTGILQQVAFGSVGASDLAYNDDGTLVTVGEASDASGAQNIYWKRVGAAWMFQGGIGNFGQKVVSSGNFFYTLGSDSVIRQWNIAAPAPPASSVGLHPNDLAIDPTTGAPISIGPMANDPAMRSWSVSPLANTGLVGLNGEGIAIDATGTIHTVDVAGVDYFLRAWDFNGTTFSLLDTFALPSNITSMAVDPRVIPEPTAVAMTAFALVAILSVRRFV